MLYHPIFGQLQDDYNTGIPTSGGDAFILKFSLSMSAEEMQREGQFRADMRLWPLFF